MCKSEEQSGQAKQEEYKCKNQICLLDVARGARRFRVQIRIERNVVFSSAPLDKGGD